MISLTNIHLFVTALTAFNFLFNTEKSLTFTIKVRNIFKFDVSDNQIIDSS